MPLSLTADDSVRAAVISASDATLEDVNLMNASESSALMSATPLPALTPLFSAAASGDTARASFWTLATDGCTYDSASGRFSCPPVSKEGLTLTRDYGFYNAGGNAMSAYDANTTASANFHIVVSGVRVAPGGADTVSRDRSMTVSGLAGQETERTWNGTATRADGGYRQDGDLKRAYHVQDVVTVSNVVVRLPRVDNRWPISGTVTHEITGTGTVSRGTESRTLSISRTLTITFNGTQFVQMTVGSVQYTLDLATGTATKN